MPCGGARNGALPVLVEGPPQIARKPWRRRQHCAVEQVYARETPGNDFLEAFERRRALERQHQPRVRELGESAVPDHDAVVAGEPRQEPIAFPGMSDSRLSAVDGDQTAATRLKAGASIPQAVGLDPDLARRVRIAELGSALGISNRKGQPVYGGL